MVSAKSVPLVTNDWWIGHPSHLYSGRNYFESRPSHPTPWQRIRW